MSDLLQRWRGRTALVTGASSGVGAEIAAALASAGLNVMLTGRDETRLAAVTQRIELTGGHAAHLVADQLEVDANARLFRHTITHYGSVDVLVNNAGMSGGRGLMDADPATLAACLDLNVRAAALCMQEAVRAMQGKADAAIINIGSLAGHRIPRGRGEASVAYAASKHALRALTDGLRIELAARSSPIQVALISPGLIDTPWHTAHHAPDPVAAYGFRPLDPADIAQAVLYILSTPRHVQVCDLLLRPIGQTF